MKQGQTQKYSVAWFKIAEFVSRGEKERALGVYRLLAHSLEDAALTLQLEGDILLSCNDERAYTIYKQAAKLYEKQQRFLPAVAIYEHLLLLQLQEDILYSVITIRYHLQHLERCYEYIDMLIAKFIEEKKWKMIQSFIEINIAHFNKEDKNNVIQHIITQLAHCQEAKDIKSWLEQQL